MPPAVKMPVLSTELSGKSLQVKFYVKLGGVCCLDELGTVRTESKLAGHHPPLRSAGPLLLLLWPALEWAVSRSCLPILFSHFLKFGEKGQRLPNRDIIYVHFLFLSYLKSYMHSSSMEFTYFSSLGGSTTFHLASKICIFTVCYPKYLKC